LKTRQVLTVVFLCVCCFASGWLCRERAQSAFERREAVRLTEQAEREAEKMVVRGTVSTAGNRVLRLDTSTGLRDLRAFYYTAALIGDQVQNQPGEVDLAKWFKPGDQVVALVDKRNRLLWIRKKE
jgi:hypothetical protein